MANDPSMDEDAALAAGLARHDAASARKIYERHGRALLRFGMAMSNCVATAEDIVHDTFVELLRRPGAYDSSRGSLRTYLYGIARHQLSKRLRSDGPRATAQGGDENTEDTPFDCDPVAPDTDRVEGAPEEQIDRARDIEQLRAAVYALPIAYREIITWCDLEELPYSTVAQILRCPIGTVRSRLHRARSLLAAQLSALGGKATRADSDSLPADPAIIAAITLAGGENPT